jgi:hypothetical protein
MRDLKVNPPESFLSRGLGNTRISVGNHIFVAQRFGVSLARFSSPVGNEAGSFRNQQSRTALKGVAFLQQSISARIAGH